MTVSYLVTLHLFKLNINLSLNCTSFQMNSTSWALDIDFSCHYFLALHARMLFFIEAHFMLDLVTLLSNYICMVFVWEATRMGGTFNIIKSLSSVLAIFTRCVVIDRWMCSVVCTSTSYTNFTVRVSLRVFLLTIWNSDFIAA